MLDMKPTEFLAYTGSLLGMITVAQTMLQNALPRPLRNLFCWIFDCLKKHFSLFHYVDIPEHDESNLANELYAAARLHLSANAASYTHRALSVKLCRTSSSREITWSPTRNQQVPMSFRGATVWWEHRISHQRGPSQPRRWNPVHEEDMEGRSKYRLTLYKRHKEHIAPYMEHIYKQMQEIKQISRQRTIYTNGKGGSYYYDSCRSSWDHAPFNHPSTFDTLAMDPQHKQQIQADLQAFLHGQEFYKKTGRAWKRGYLLHGPPGTGKSSLIAAMANFLCYDVYDLELTHVRSNGDLRKLLLKTTSKSIIVIEDIDCSLDLTNKRGNKFASSSSSSRPSPSKSKYQGDEQSGVSMVTLSGLLNLTDGLWSCCGEERIFVFTTNHVENLDPALLRPGRMDRHILMSYCTYPAFKILAMNYLDLDSHPLFPKVEEVIEHAHLTPAEVSEVLMRNRHDGDKAMKELVDALYVAKARPWPPPAPPKKAVKEEPVDEEEFVSEEEVVKTVVRDRKNRSREEERCPYCPCRKEEKKVGKKVGRAKDAVCKCKPMPSEECVDKGEMPQSNSKKVECQEHAAAPTGIDKDELMPEQTCSNKKKVQKAD